MAKTRPGAAAADQSAGKLSIEDTTSAKCPQRTPDAQDVIKNINFNTEADPELNPASPAFNEMKYREFLSKCDVSDIKHRLDRILTQANDAAQAAAVEITGHGVIPQAIAEAAISSLRELTSIMQWAKDGQNRVLTPELRRLFETVDSTGEAVDWGAIFDGLKAGQDRIEALTPFLEAELPEIHKHQGYEDMQAEELKMFLGLDGETIIDPPDGETVPEFIREAIQHAQAAAYKASLPASTAKRAKIIEYPVDKVNSTIWNLLQETTGRQIKFALKAEKDGSKKPLNIYYSIDFDQLEESGIKITKKLQPFDKRVYIAISALYNAGNNVITLTQIYFAMGNTGRPPKYTLQKIQDSITKMTAARVFVDNTEESQTYNYPRFKYDGALLPLERATAVINGQLADAAIHIFREPPVMTFAKQRRQITSITVKVLQSPISKTDANLIIDDYLIERITAAKNRNKPSKILYETLYEKTGITEKKQRQRAPEKIKTYLDHYKSCGLISGYKMLKDGIQIEY